jgi:hypothetical protein
MSASVASKHAERSEAKDVVSAPAAASCATCQYAKPHEANLTALFFCRRHPPIPSALNPIHAIFPVVSGGDWCGDFITIPPPPLPAIVDVPYCSQEGSMLSCTMGNWTGEPTSYAYQWKRDGVAVGGNTDINTYDVTADDAGITYTCIVTASNETGSATAPPSNEVVVVDPDAPAADADLAVARSARSAPAPAHRTRNNRHR